MGFDGRLTPVREDSSSSLQYRARLYAPSAFNKPAKDASDADIETAPVQSIRTGPSNGAFERQGTLQLCIHSCAVAIFDALLHTISVCASTVDGA